MRSKLNAGFLSGSLVLCALLCVLVFSGAAFGQAKVNENLETAFIYVDVNTGSDSNPGTKAEPFKTIGRAASVALQNNENGIGTRVTIDAGTYPESIALAATSKSTSLPMTFEAATKGTVSISGTDPWTGWQPYTSNPNIYTHAWPYAWGLCPRATGGGPTEQDINLRREMIFVSQAMLTQVLALSELTPGTFYVDETGGTVYIYPALGTDIGSADVEVATREKLFQAQNMTNVVLRGLEFEHGNDCRDNDTVAFIGGNNILVQSDGFNWNNAGAIGFDGTTQFTAEDSTAKHNGQRGFKSYEAKNGEWINDESDYNNWRGSQGGIYGWAGGGFYFFGQHDNTESNLRMFYNMSHGIHWDTDNANDSAYSLIASSNLLDGLVVEKSEGPVLIADSHVCFNAPISLYYDGGMTLRTSTYVTLENNSFANNYVSQIPIIGTQGGVPMEVTNYETGQVYELLTENLTMKSNVIQGLAGEQLVDDFDQSGQAWSDFQTTLSSNDNTWWNASVAQPFTVPVPNYYTTIDWAQWKSLTGQDQQSKFAAPKVDPTTACQVQADAPDYWFIDYDNGALTTKAGSPATYTLFLFPLGGFDGKTFFTSSGVNSIPGAGWSWSSPSLTGSGTVTFTVSTKSTTPQGTYSFTLAAQSGNLTRTVTVFLTVQ